MLSTRELTELDRQHLWHPYTSFNDPMPVYPVRRAQGVHIELADGRKLVDGVSSWWSVIHGYNHPAMNQAIKEQLHQFSHVMFGGLTHEPAAKLASKLVEITPAGLNKVFFSDSGSVAVEVALKMALQYWHSRGQAQRTTFLALKSGYHGDTFGAMGVCDPHSGMHHLFHQNISHNLFAEQPSCKFGDEWDEHSFANFSHLLQRNRQKIAAVILEPIMQGAGGMRFYSPVFLQKVRELCDDLEVLLIADEIATGFGRTGKLFACEHAGISPDIMCLGKALTGGYITLAATLCNDKVSDGISRGQNPVFMHGPTFMANPLACAAANASLDILLKQDWQEKVQQIEQQLKTELEPCKTLSTVKDVRVLGAVGVVELKEPAKVAELQAQFVAQNIWVRPFGQWVYLMPPFIINEQELRQLTQGVFHVLGNL
ncbi:MAG TPA: adenosylmethionine--8-amino-7-oxononanoate transaminase [Cellvibrio sp.]